MGPLLYFFRLISFGEEEGAKKTGSDAIDADRDSLENFFDDDEYHDEAPEKPAGKRSKYHKEGSQMCCWGSPWDKQIK
jgi:hypothetical protein